MYCVLTCSECMISDIFCSFRHKNSFNWMEGILGFAGLISCCLLAFMMKSFFENDVLYQVLCPG